MCEIQQIKHHLKFALTQQVPYVCESKSHLVESKILPNVSLSIGQLQKHLNVICLMNTMDTDFSTILF